MLPAAAILIAFLIGFFLKKGLLFSGELVVETSDHRKDHDNVVAAVRLFGKCQCKRALE